jgi:hypothetical protein
VRATESVPFRPSEWDASVDAASYTIVNQRGGTHAYLEVARDVDREAVRAWLREWLESNRAGLPAGVSEAAMLWLVIKPAGTSFAVGQISFGPGGPRDAVPAPVETLVDAALRDLSAVG